MPEGDTIHRLATRIDRVFKGHEVVRFQTNEPHLRRDDLVCRTILGSRAQGKNLIVDLSGGLSLHSHLQMRGQWFIERPAQDGDLFHAGSPVHGEYRPAQLRIAVAHASLLALQLRVVRFLPTNTTLRGLAHLGPDLLAKEFDASLALSNLRACPDLVIAVALMRQDLVAGVGNVYKSETLFLQRMHPLAPVASWGDQELLDLLECNRRLLKRNLTSGPRRTRFGAGGPRLWVYRRSGQRCMRCGEPIAMQRLGPQLRSTYFCPSCQARPSR